MPFNFIALYFLAPDVSTVRTGPSTVPVTEPAWTQHGPSTEDLGMGMLRLYTTRITTSSMLRKKIVL